MEAKSRVEKGAYTAAQSWDSVASLTPAQIRAIGSVSAALSTRPLPPHLLGLPGAADSSEGDVAGTSAVAGPESSVGDDSSRRRRSESTSGALTTTSEFYTWWAEQEEENSKQQEARFQRYADELGSHLSLGKGLLEEIDGVLKRLEELKALHGVVGKKTQTLNDSCNNLVAEEARLQKFADTLRERLVYFDELEQVASKFSNAKLNVGSEEFLSLLRRVDDCIAFVTQNPQYADSASYGIKFSQLQSRALSTVRTYVGNVLKRAMGQVTEAIKEASVDGVLPEGAETSALRVRFQAAAAGMKALVVEMEKRDSSEEYSKMLSDCHSAYCEQRLAVMLPVVEKRIGIFAAPGTPLTSVVRSGCAYLLTLVKQEHELFVHIFPAAASASPSPLNELLEPLAEILYDIVRPQLLYVPDIESICELIGILKGEVIDEQLGGRADSMSGLMPTLTLILTDMQERLIFRAQNSIRDDILGFRPLPSDLDYPACLLPPEQEGGGGGEATEGTTSLTGEGNEIQNGNKNSDGNRDRPLVYPAVAMTLNILARLYRCVDATTFSGLAQEAVSACTTVVRDTQKQITRRSSETDALLFQVRQLLYLREQIAPFEAEFSFVEKELDFSHMRDYFRRIAGGGNSLFTFSTTNPLVSLVSDGVPRVNNIRVDSKLELETVLKQTCESFIMQATKVAVEPMLSFITKVTAVRVASGGKAIALKDHAFAAPARVAEVVGKVNEALSTVLPAMVKRMKIYLRSDATQSILFKPIKSNIAEAHGQIATVLEVEYSAEDIAAVSLKPPAELGALLDALL